MRGLLDRLGSPESIVVAEAGPSSIADPDRRPGARPARGWGALELVAGLLLTIGMFVLPVLGPLLGLGLAWLSSYWSTRE